MDAMIKEKNSESRSDEAVSFKDLFTLKEFRWPLITSLVLQLTQQLSGINAVFHLYTHVLNWNLNCIQTFCIQIKDILLLEWYIWTSQYQGGTHTIRYICHRLHQCGLHNSGGAPDWETGPQAFAGVSHVPHGGWLYTADNMLDHAGQGRGGWHSGFGLSIFEHRLHYCVHHVFRIWFR